MLLVHLVIPLLELLLKKNAQFSMFSWCNLIWFWVVNQESPLWIAQPPSMKWSNRTCRMIETDLLSSKHHTQQLPVLPFFHRRQHAQWFVRNEEFGDMQEWLSSEKNTTERTLFPLKRWHKDAARDNLLLYWLIEPHVFDLLLLSSNLILYNRIFFSSL